MLVCGPGSSDGIATDYVLEGPGTNRVQTGPGAEPACCKIGTGSFPEVNCGRVVRLATHSLLVPRSRKRRAIPTLCANRACNRDYFIFFYVC